MKDDDKTASQMFGDQPPGTPVKHKEPTHLAGYRPRGRWVRLSVNGHRWVRLAIDDRIETQDHTRTREPDDDDRD